MAFENMEQLDILDTHARGKQLTKYTLRACHAALYLQSEEPVSQMDEFVTILKSRSVFTCL